MQRSPSRRQLRKSCALFRCFCLQSRSSVPGLHWLPPRCVPAAAPRGNPSGPVWLKFILGVPLFLTDQASCFLQRPRRAARVTCGHVKKARPLVGELRLHSFPSCPGLSGPSLESFCGGGRHEREDAQESLVVCASTTTVLRRVQRLLCQDNQQGHDDL